MMKIERRQIFELYHYNITIFCFRKIQIKDFAKNEPSKYSNDFLVGFYQVYAKSGVIGIDSLTIVLSNKQVIHS